VLQTGLVLAAPPLFYCLFARPQASALEALLSLDPGLGCAPMSALGYRPLDLLARNAHAPVEAFEVLLDRCPAAIDRCAPTERGGVRITQLITPHSNAQNSSQSSHGHH